jgi:hypothetical protein
MAKEEKEKKDQGQPSVIPPTPGADDNNTPGADGAGDGDKDKDADKGKDKDKKPEPAVEVPELNDRKEYKISITKKTKHLKEGQIKTVSGNIARQLIKIGVAKLI